MPPQIPNSLTKILPRRERSALGSLEVYPEHVSFNSQDPGESIYILMRSHIAVNVGWVVRFAVGVVFPFIVVTIFEIFNMILTSREIPPIAYKDLMPFSTWAMVFLFYYSLAVTYALANFLDWYFDVYLVTNIRILHVDFRVFTGKFVAEAALANIEDVSTNIIGFLPSFFNYGDVLVQTAAEKTKFNLISLSNPSWFRDVITDLSNLAKTKRDHPRPGNTRVERIVTDDDRGGGEP
jgi:hypothetical protein